MGSSADRYDSYQEYAKASKRVERDYAKYLKQRQSGAIDDQTLMFWNLQLQFMDMNLGQLSMLAAGVLGGLAAFFVNEHNKEDAATQLALYLSGLS